MHQPEMQQPGAQLPSMDNWRDWALDLQAKPRVKRTLSELNDNSANAIYLISDGAKELVLKQYAPNPAYQSSGEQLLAIDSWQNAIARPPYSLAAAVLYRDPRNHYAIFEYFDAATLQAGAALNQSLLETLCQAIHRYHCYSIQWPVDPISYTGRCEHYLSVANNHFSTAGITKLEQRYRELRDDCVQHLQRAGEPLVCCHNDLNPGNILYLKNSSTPAPLRILDWDFASPGVAAMDFASLGVELGIDCKLLATIAGLQEIQLATAYRVYTLICDTYEEILRAARR
ncbi:MAG: phosphotransferase [Pseudomonadales bacterium]|nr:phosphotransferase [Pseudomonadales bacterium]